MTVRFTTEVAPDLPWRFGPEQRQVTVHLGEEKLVFFSAQNLTDRPIVGHAAFNVTPTKAGIYFNKIQCFCFTEERLDPRQKVDMPVDFFVDPKLGTDPETRESRYDHAVLHVLSLERPGRGKGFVAVCRRRQARSAARAKLFAERCAACHALDRNKIGPMLGDVVGRHAGSGSRLSLFAGIARGGDRLVGGRR